MQLTYDTDHQQYSILSYTPGQLTLVQPRRVDLPGGVEDRKKLVTTSCVLTPRAMFDAWPPQTFEDLVADHFAALLKFEPEVVIFGAGTKIRFPSPSLTAPLINRGIGVEVMDTGAACRTYNFLMIDGRKVLAALLL